MFKKTAITTGIFAALVVPSMTVLAAEEVKTNGQSEALRLMEQTRAYVRQENQYRYYAAADTSQQTSQDKTRNMYGADNDTGQGELKRERIRHRDGTGSGSQNKYGQSSSGGQYGAGNGGGSGYGSGRGSGGGGRR
ncbi:MAG: hypothetical protein HKM94_03170 [Halobacteria archaeon]|nr:hypothetical protein [Halobacteria archaeon]